MVPRVSHCQMPSLSISELLSLQNRRVVVLCNVKPGKVRDVLSAGLVSEPVAVRLGVQGLGFRVLWTSECVVGG